jgi:antitoxin ParD1/3/4
MSHTTTLTVRISGALSDFVAQNVSEGVYENVSEYIRDLIRKDKAQADEAAFQRLKAELAHAFAAPETAYKPLSASDVINRNRA